MVEIDKEKQLLTKQVNTLKRQLNRSQKRIDVLTKDLEKIRGIGKPAAYVIIIIGILICSVKYFCQDSKLHLIMKLIVFHGSFVFVLIYYLELKIFLSYFFDIFKQSF